MTSDVIFDCRAEHLNSLISNVRSKLKQNGISPWEIRYYPSMAGINFLSTYLDSLRDSKVLVIFDSKEPVLGKTGLGRAIEIALSSNVVILPVYINETEYNEEVMHDKTLYLTSLIISILNTNT